MSYIFTFLAGSFIGMVVASLIFSIKRDDDE